MIKLTILKEIGVTAAAKIKISKRLSSSAPSEFFQIADSSSL
jgi:hypothetical protein